MRLLTPRRLCRRGVRVCGSGRGAGAFLDLAALHDEADLLHHADVLQRIAGHGDDVGEQTVADRTDLFVAFDKALARGDLVAGRALWRQLKPLTEGLFAEPSPGPVKALLAACGECANGLRPPMTPASAVLQERLLVLMATLPVSA